MNINQIETPALVLDKTILMENIAAMEKILAGTPLKLRPHYKSHKCAQLAHLQLEHGACGMTCSKLSEAVDLLDSGVEDILIANQIVEPAKIERLARLALCAKITVCVDDIDNIKALSEAAENCGSVINCLVEYEIGMERCGVSTKEEVLELCKEIVCHKSLHYEGIQAYAGHISHMESDIERQELTNKNSQKIKELIAYLSKNGIETKTISGGSTGTSKIKAGEGLYTELQAGSYLFMDSTYSLLDVPFKNSLFVLTTVVSNKGGITVVDAGVKTCGVDQGMPAIVDNCAEKLVASEEHFQLHKLSKKATLGQKLMLIPGHCCSTINLHDKIYLVENGKVVDRLLVTGRGFGK